MPSTNPVDVERLPPAPFLDARTVFDLNPNRCIETLESVSDDLRVLGIPIALMKFFIRSGHNHDFLKCWIEI